MKQNSSIFYALLLIVGDFLALVGAFTVAYILRVKYDTRPLIEQIPSEAYLYGFLTVLPLWILVHAVIGLYNRDVYENRFREIGRLMLGSFLGMLVVIGYDFIIDDTLFPARLVAVYGFVLSLAFLIVFRAIARLFRSAFFNLGVGITNVLIVGNTNDAEAIIHELEHTKRSGHRIIGVVTEGESKHPTFKTFHDATDKLGPNKIHTIIQAELFNKTELNDEVMVYAQSHHIAYKFIPSNNELFVGNIEVELFRGTPVVTVHQTPLVGWGSIFKRLFDILVSATLIILLSPILLLTALFIKILNPRESVLFSQARLTQFDRSFTVYKFRSQQKRFDGTTPEQAFEKLGKPELAEAYRRGGDHIPADPRLIKGGKFLRAASLDELPQLFNVLKGDISLVGPRALIPQELRAYQKKHHILSIKSGLTGLAQVSGRRNLSFDERRKLDLYYVQNWSFWLDITILLKTLRAVINGIGAK